MAGELVFKIKNKSYDTRKYLLQKDKKPININDVDTKNIVLSSKTPYGKQGANKYYAGYLNGGFRPLNIVIKDTELCADSMHVLTNHTKFLK